MVFGFGGLDFVSGSGRGPLVPGLFRACGILGTTSRPPSLAAAPSCGRRELNVDQSQTALAATCVSASDLLSHVVILCRLLIVSLFAPPHPYTHRSAKEYNIKSELGQKLPNRRNGLMPENRPQNVRKCHQNAKRQTRSEQTAQKEMTVALSALLLPRLLFGFCHKRDKRPNVQSSGTRDRMT